MVVSQSFQLVYAICQSSFGTQKYAVELSAEKSVKDK